MSDILQDLSPLTLTWAMDANFVEFHKQLGCLPGSEVCDDPEMMWYATPIRMGGFNGVVRANLREEDVARKVAEVAARFRERDRRWNWAVGPTSQPSDLGERLQASGLRLGGSELGMALDLQALKDDLPAPPGFSVVPVRDAATLSQYMHAMVTGFGPPEAFSRAWGDVFACLGLGEERPMQHYIGLLDGEPVATSSVFYGAGVAGIYFVATVPHARNKGIGSLMTATPLQDARARGYRAAILQASQMGSSIYRKLGFESYGLFAFYDMN